MNSLSVTRIHYESIIVFAYLLLKNDRFREFTINSLSIALIHFECTIYFAKTISIFIFVINSLWIHYQLRASTMYPLSFSRFYHPLRKFCMNSLLFSRIHFEFTIFFANSLWIHYLFREYTTNSLSLSRNNYEFTISSLESLWIIYFFPIPLFFSIDTNHFEFIISYELNMDPWCFSWNHFELSITYANL